MSIIEGWSPPTREHWVFTVGLWQWFPLVAIVQILSAWYPMGKTSYPSRLNIPGKIGWLTMEAPGVINLLYIMFTLPAQLGIESLPWPNWLMAGLFTLHYINRAFLTPFLNPSMSPIHVIPWASALGFQLFNSTSIGGWLAGHGPRTFTDWLGDAHAPRFLVPRIEVGMMIWAVALLANLYHDDELREIRRAAARSQKAKQDAQGEKGRKSVDKVYQVPENGLFRLVLYPHYLTEWIEWAGFWMVGGINCAPARIFLVNEIAAMLPRAVRGRQWYIERFGRDRIGSRKAIIPWIL